MKNIIFCLIILPLVLFPLGCFSQADNNVSLCKGQDATLQCLKENFKVLYIDDYDIFWDILHQSSISAKKCNSVDNTSEFLELTIYIGNNAEVQEFYAENIEKLCITNEYCFFNALKNMETETGKSIVERLHHPIYIEESKIRNVFTKSRKNKEFQNIIEIYFDK